MKDLLLITVVTYVKEINKNLHSHHYVHMHVSDLPVPIVLRCFFCHTRFQNHLETTIFEWQSCTLIISLHLMPLITAVSLNGKHRADS